MDSFGETAFPESSAFPAVDVAFATPSLNLGASTDAGDATGREVPTVQAVEDALVVYTPSKHFETGVQESTGVLGLFGMGRGGKDGRMALLPSYVEVRSYTTEPVADAVTETAEEAVDENDAFGDAQQPKAQKSPAADPTGFVKVAASSEVVGLPERIVELFSGPLLCVVYSRRTDNDSTGARQKSLSQVEVDAQAATDAKSRAGAEGGNEADGGRGVLCSQFYLVVDAYSETDTTTHLTTVLRTAPDAPLPPKPAAVISSASQKTHRTQFVPVGAEFPAASHVSWCNRSGLVAVAVGGAINIFQLVAMPVTPHADDPFADSSGGVGGLGAGAVQTNTEHTNTSDTVTREKELPKGAKLPEGVKLPPEVTTTADDVTTVSTSYSVSDPRTCRLVPVASTGRYCSVPAAPQPGVRWHSAHTYSTNITHMFWTSGRGLVVSSVTAAAAAAAGGGRVCSSDVCMLVLPTLSETSVLPNSGTGDSDKAVPLHPVVVLPIFNPSPSETRLYSDRENGRGALRFSNNAAVCEILARAASSEHPECLGLHAGSLLFTST